MVALAAILAAVLLGAVALGAVLLEDAPDDDACCAPPDVARAQPAAAAAALSDLVTAIEDRDEEAAARLAPEGDADSASLLAAVVRNTRLLDLRGVSARYVAEVGTVGADGTWSAVVAMTWRMQGFDPRAASSEVLVSFAPDGTGGGVITGFGGAAAPGRRTPLWLQGPLAVVRTADPEALVLVDGPRRVARVTADRARRGVAVVRRTLPRWRGPVVVEVPASAAAMDAVLGAEPGTYAGVAAVTAPVDGAAGARAPVHVFVNPDVGRGLRDAGAQVVMSHELTHLATGAVRSRATPWLLEGFADWVALRDLRLPDTATLGRAIALVEREGVPEDLPGPADLDPRAPDLQAAYELAWLACRVLAEQVGADALVRLHGRVDAGAPLGAELRRAGTSESELVRAWRARLAQLAG